MPFAINQGIRVHYEVEGTGEPLVLHHGLLFCGDGWRDDGYAERLKEHYQLILLDARGHGASDKPTAPTSYSASTMAEDVLTVMDELSIRRTHFWGYSLGGAVGFSLLKYAPGRLRSLVVGGFTPYAPFSAEQAQTLAAIRADLVVATQGGMKAWLAAIEQRSGVPFPAQLARRLERNDPPALLACCDGVLLSWVGVEDTLKVRTTPCLLYSGESDPYCSYMRQAAHDLPNASFFSLLGLAHVPAWFAIDQVLPQVESFLGSVVGEAD